MRYRKRNWPAEDFQMAPMIDMVFLLLVFFMCVSNLSQADRRVAVALPDSAESRVPTDLSGRQIVSLTADGAIYFGSRRTTLERLSASLAAAHRDGVFRVQLRIDRGVPFRQVKPVLKACGEAGVTDIIYSTYQKS